LNFAAEVKEVRELEGPGVEITAPKGMSVRKLARPGVEVTTPTNAFSAPPGMEIKVDVVSEELSANA